MWKTPAICALKAQNDSEGFYLRVVPTDSAERKKKQMSKDDSVTFQSNTTSYLCHMTSTQECNFNLILTWTYCILRKFTS